MENAIIIRANNQFKSKSLNTATAGLAKAFKNIENGRKDACAILAKVERNKSYEEDGFKSLAEYAETIGLEKSLAHKMENAGRMLISEDEEIKAFADKTDFSKLAILSSAPVEKVKEAIQNGALSPESTQSEVKSLKAEFNKSDKTKVLKDKTFCIFNGLTRELFSYVDVAIRDENDFMPGIFSQDFFKVGSVSGITLWRGDQKEASCNGDVLDEKVKWDIYQGRYDLITVYVASFPIKKESKKTVKSVKELTPEELVALAEKYGMKVSF